MKDWIFAFVGVKNYIIKGALCIVSFAVNSDKNIVIFNFAEDIKEKSGEGGTSLLRHMGVCTARIATMNQYQNISGAVRPNHRILMESPTGISTTKQLEACCLSQT